MSKNLKIIVCAHKADGHIKTDEPYFPLQVGKELHPELDLGFACDNTGDNISEKNPSYCELTALYWGWKNIHDVEYLGLNHYRRYFKVVDIVNTVEQIMGGDYVDIIVAKNPDNLSKRQRMNDLIRVTSMEDAFLFADTFLSIYPQYEQSFINYFYNSRKSYPFQLFIAKKYLYDEYCGFMFPVLELFEKRSKLHGYTRQKRVVGYLGEVFLGLFIECKQLNVKALAVEDFSKSGNYSQIKHFIKGLPYKFVDMMNRRPAHVIVPDAVKVGFRTDGIDMLYLK